MLIPENFELDLSHFRTYRLPYNFLSVGSDSNLVTHLDNTLQLRYSLSNALQLLLFN